MTAGGAVLVDTGPLVALFDPSDNLHSTAIDALDVVEGRTLVTTLAVLTEATYLLAFSDRAQQALLAFAAADLVVAPFGGDDVARAARLMAKYRDLPMDLADATLVVLAERLRTTTVLTFDRRDFQLYRAGRKKLRLLPDQP